MSELLHVSSSPHVRSKVDTSSIMLTVIIALLPATLFGIYNFGPHALLLVLVTIAACVATEAVYEKIVHKKSYSEGLQRSSHRTSAGAEPSSKGSLVDCCDRRHFCYLSGKTAFRRPGTELYEPCTGCPLLPFDFLRGKNVCLHL